MVFMYTGAEFGGIFFDLRSENTERNLLVGSTLRIAGSGYPEVRHSILRDLTVWKV